MLDTQKFGGAALPECWSLSQTEPSTARERILVSASRQFCRRGFAATGVDSVIDEAGAAKATLYKHFPSKQALISAVLEAEGEMWRRWFFARLRARGGPPLTRLLSVFDVLEEWFADPDFYGCPFINAIAEFEADDTLARAAAERHKEPLRTWISAIAIELGAEDPREFTRAIVVQIDGAIVAAQHSRDPTFAGSARSVAELLAEAMRGDG